MDATTTSGIVITVISIACLITVIILLNNTLKRSLTEVIRRKKTLIKTSLFFLLWMVILGVLSKMGVFTSAGLPPRPMFTVITGLIILFSLSYTKTFRQLLIAAPLHWLIFFQSFRIAVELWFWYSAQNGVFPSIMTFEGENWDILSGSLAIIAGVLVLRLPSYSRIIAIVFNILGFLILSKTLFTAAASMPSSFQKYPFDERLVQLGEFPLIYLPGVLVVLALGFHLLSLRQIYLKKNREAERKELNVAAVL